MITSSELKCKKINENIDGNESQAFVNRIGQIVIFEL